MTGSKEFGLTIVVESHVSDLFNALMIPVKLLKAAQDACLDYWTTRTFCNAAHASYSAQCYFCSLMHAQYKFWGDLAYWMETCDDCLLRRYECKCDHSCECCGCDPCYYY